MFQRGRKVKEGRRWLMNLRVTTLGKHSTGAGCLYIKRLSDVRLEVLSKAAMQE